MIFEDTVSVAKYTCQNGFTISGQSVLSCRSDGTWNVSSPICGELHKDHFDYTPPQTVFVGGYTVFTLSVVRTKVCP